jgi:hypothetical protein
MGRIVLGRRYQTRSANNFVRISVSGSFEM